MGMAATKVHSHQWQRTQETVTGHISDTTNCHHGISYRGFLTYTNSAMDPTTNTSKTTTTYGGHIHIPAKQELVAFKAQG